VLPSSFLCSGRADMENPFRETSSSLVLTLFHPQGVNLVENTLYPSRRECRLILGKNMKREREKGGNVHEKREEKGAKEMHTREK
jgi:hypothetical protein